MVGHGWIDPWLVNRDIRPFLLRGVRKEIDRRARALTRQVEWVAAWLTEDRMAMLRLCQVGLALEAPRPRRCLPRWMRSPLRHCSSSTMSCRPRSVLPRATLAHGYFPLNGNDASRASKARKPRSATRTVTLMSSPSKNLRNRIVSFAKGNARLQGSVSSIKNDGATFNCWLLPHSMMDGFSCTN